MDEILTIGLKEIDSIYEFNKICFENDYFNRDTWLELLDDYRTIVYIISENEFIKSFLAIYNWKDEDDYIKIMTIGTHPDYRGNGYAQKLMEYMIGQMTKEEMYVYKGETRESNLKMQKIFEKLGYEIIRKVEGYYDNPVETAYKYSLEIE
ncbi:MAG: GNAT family N-acetyltransferase [Tissierellia bacterium]|nr:GNAT family N-acetyltransferase [Tissierellia bacterium]